MLIVQVLPKFPITSVLWYWGGERNRWNRAAGYQPWIPIMRFEISGKV